MARVWGARGGSFLRELPLPPPSPHLLPISHTVTDSLCAGFAGRRGHPPGEQPQAPSEDLPGAFRGEGRDPSPGTEQKGGRGHTAVPYCGPVPQAALPISRNSAGTALRREARVPSRTHQPSERGVLRPGPRTQPLGRARGTHPSRARRLFPY